MAVKAAQCVKPMRGQFVLDALNGQPFAGTTEDGLDDVEGVFAALEAEAGVSLDTSQRQAFVAALDCQRFGRYKDRQALVRPALPLLSVKLFRAHLIA